MMKDTNAEDPSTWRRPLKGWLWWTTAALVVASLSAITWLVIGYSSNEFYNGTTPPRWLLSIGIALVVALLLGLLVKCLCSWRNLKRLLIGIACLAGLVALFYTEEDLRGILGWNRFKARWEAKGEKFDFASFIPPSIPDDQNFAMAPVVATSYAQFLDRDGRKKAIPDTNIVDRLQMPLDFENGGPPRGIGNWQKALISHLEPWQDYYRKLSLKTNLFPVALQEQSAAADVLLALSKYDSTIEELRKAAALPGSRFPINYDRQQPFAALLPHLAHFKSCVVILRLRSLAEIDAGQAEPALADVCLALSLIEKIRSEPFLISHLVRIALFQITEQAIWEGLAKRCWTDSQISRLEQQLAGFDFVADYQAALRAENACQVAAIDSVRHRVIRLADFGGAFDEKKSEHLGYLVPAGWFDQNKLCGSKFILEKFMPVADLKRQAFSPTLLNQASESLSEMRPGPYTMSSKMLLPALSRSAQKFAFSQACLNLARCACALERYRLANGKYPETIDPLAPKFVSKTPCDPVDGQPLHYRLTEDGSFILYSVGWNQTDDGGHVRFRKGGSIELENGDWVWRYPKFMGRLDNFGE